MHLGFLKNKQLLVFILGMTFVGFVILSWWLLFRDERALQGFEAVYPFLSGNLTSFRAVLLQYSLNVVPTILFLILGIFSFWAYFQSLKKNYSINTVIKYALIFQLVVFFSYPILSTDIFSYVFSNRVATEYHQNKWLVSPDHFSNDTFEQFADWKQKTNIYGYVNHLLYLPAEYLGNDGVFSTIVLYKVTTAIFALLTLVLFLKLVSDLSEQKREYYLKLVFWNPLFLLEILGSGHNDIFLLFFILLSLFAWKNKNYIFAGAAIALSVQVKLISIIFFGFYFLKLLQQKKISESLLYGGSFLSINIFSFALMQVNPLLFLQRVFYNAESYWQSLPGLASRFLPMISIPFTAIFALICFTLLFFQFKKNWNPLFTSILSIFLYLLFFTGAYWNWYVLWIFLFVPFMKNALLERSIVVFTVTSFFAYPLLWFSHRFGFGNSVWDVVQYVWIFCVPIGYMLYNDRKREER